ncbi:MAG: recombinase family protein [Clostridia bacterium]|nr:recombinase family protein [Clostridia bacterium]
MRCAIYCRLSKEDEEKQLESESIQNQKALLLRYAAQQNWDVAAIYIDSDYSGTDRDRPAFCTMLREARAHSFDIVLCKTQSRFTRDMELVEKYIHYLFPLWGIRFVTAVDHVDTALRGNKKARQINGLINEWYLEDLSENIRAVFGHKRRTGQYIGALAAYGYRKDASDHHRLCVDPPAAAVVQDIYRWYLEGMGKQKIADKLNRHKIPSPAAYREGTKKSAWTKTAVGRILKNEIYTGVMVQGKRRKVSYKSKQMRQVPPEEWVRVEGTHEAIVSQQEFRRVQALLRCKTDAQQPAQRILLEGKLFCGVCGETLNQVRAKSGTYLRCKNCKGVSITWERLRKLLLEKMQPWLPSEANEKWLPVLIGKIELEPIDRKTKQQEMTIYWKI